MPVKRGRREMGTQYVLIPMSSPTYGHKIVKVSDAKFPLAASWIDEST